MIYLLYGNDKALIKRKIDKICEDNNISRDSISQYSLFSDNIIDIIDDANTIGLFSIKKTIIVNDAFIFTSSKDKAIDISVIEDYINNYNKDTILIFNIVEEKIDSRKKITKLLEKNGKIIELSNKNNSDIVKYITDYIENNDYKIDNSNISYLINRLGNNIDLIINELDKIMLYKMEDKNITRSDIDELTEPSIEEEIFNLTDAVVKGDVKRSIDLFHYFLEKNYDSLQMIAMLGNQFRLLFQVKRFTNKGYREADIAKELGIHPYRVKLAMQTNYYYTENNYLKYLYKLADMDEKIKMGQIDKNVSLELFLLKKDMEVN